VQGTRRWLVLACGLLAAIPIFVAAGHAISIRWVPLSDLGYTAVKSFDVFSGRSPLVGQWSSGASAAANHLTYSPGPLLFWVLAAPTRWMGPSAPAVAAGVVNVACVIGAVALAHRRGGAPLALATALAVPVMLRSLPGETYSDPWNSSAPLMPLVLLFFVAWSVACGEYRLLPLAVLVGSFAAQSHLTFVTPVVLLLMTAVVALAINRPRGEPDLRRWVLAGVGVAVVCWSFPLIDQAVHRPGNLVLLVRAATTDQATLGWHTGWHAMAHTIGVVPWWLGQPKSGFTWITDLGNGTGALRTITTLLVLGALLGVAAIGWRRRRPEVWTVGLLGLALSVAVAIDVSSTPKTEVATVVYTLRWTSPAGMCVWLGLGWALVALAPKPARVPVVLRPAALVGVVALAAIAVAVAVAADPVDQPYRQMRAIDKQVTAALPPGTATRVDAADLFAAAFQSGLVYWLRHEGRDVVAPSMLKPLGPDYAKGHYDQVVRVQVQDAANAQRPPGRLLAKLPYEQPYTASPHKVVTASLLPARGR
jgi:hypothetical protein